MALRRAGASRSVPLLFLLALCAFILFTSSTASGASLIAKDGKIHACYKAKGKGKGTLRVVRNGKVRCPKKWKKTSWYASGVPGTQGEAGAPGSAGEGGTEGLPGAAGTTGTVVVKQLEDKVTELLAKVKSLEALIPTVTALCTQASALTNQVNSLESVLSGLKLNAVLTTLGGLLEIPTLPGGLPSFSCPG
ncbi:MAG: hypothetical protein ACTHKT_10820 [Solirubrobacterales bacterium]